MVRVFQVDAFTDEPFRGNPAAVCLLDDQADKQWMQDVAAEMNLSETAFTFQEGDHFHLQWFTPKVEVELCGHATLATSHVLWETGLLLEDQVAIFETLSGQLRARRQGAHIQLDFPATPPVETRAPTGLIAALGVSPVYVGMSTFDYLVEVETAKTVRQLQPDFEGLRSLGVRGVMVTSRDESGEFDFVSRFFAPGAGIDEDPVTGSAHCTLGPYWRKKLHRTDLNAFQASWRGGQMKVSVDGDRVLLLGQAVTVLSGELLVSAPLLSESA